jgi:hypothetical protein
MSLLVDAIILTGDKKNKRGAIPGKGNVAKARSSVTTKNADTATSTGDRGQKRKSDARPQDDADDENPPAKKGKSQPAKTRPVPRPVQKKTKVQEEEMMDHSDHHNSTLTKKRSSEAVDNSDPEDAKTLVPSKRAKIQPNKSKDGPIRRTGKPFSFLLQLS